MMLRLIPNDQKTGTQIGPFFVGHPPWVTQRSPSTCLYSAGYFVMKTVFFINVLLCYFIVFIFPQKDLNRSNIKSRPFFLDVENLC